MSVAKEIDDCIKISNPKIPEIYKEVPNSVIITYKRKKDIPSTLKDKIKEYDSKMKIVLYDDNDCSKFLRDNYGLKYSRYFQQIKDGPIKADYFRVFYINKMGGFYLDADVVINKSLGEYKHESKVTVPTSCWIYKGQERTKLNPLFFSAPPEHPVLFYAVEIYKRLFNNGIQYSYWNYSIVKIMSSIYNKHPEYFNIVLNEVCPNLGINKQKYHIKSTETDEIVMYNRSKNYDEKRHEFKKKDK